MGVNAGALTVAGALHNDLVTGEAEVAVLMMDRLVGVAQDVETTIGDPGTTTALETASTTTSTTEAEMEGTEMITLALRDDEVLKIITTVHLVLVGALEEEEPLLLQPPQLAGRRVRAMVPVLAGATTMVHQATRIGPMTREEEALHRVTETLKNSATFTTIGPRQRTMGPRAEADQLISSNNQRQGNLQRNANADTKMSQQPLKG